MDTANPTTVTISTERKKKITFFSLPPELRNKVYREELLRKGSASISQIAFGPPALVIANPKVTAESASIFWLENTFCFENETLSERFIGIFETHLGDVSRQLTRVAIRRTFTIADMKPITIRFVVKIRKEGKRIAIVRPTDEERPHPGIPGVAKFKSPYTEPCRCEVRQLAAEITTRANNRLNGTDLLSFMSKYVELVRSPGTNPMLQICATCNSARRT